MKTTIGVSIIIAMTSVLAACSATIYCPSASQLLDIADRCYTGRDSAACDAWWTVSERCKKCRAMMLTEQNEAMRRINRQCEGMFMGAP